MKIWYVGVVALVAACGSEVTIELEPNASSVSASSTTGEGGTTTTVGPGGADVGGGSGGQMVVPCADGTLEAQMTKKPADIIFVIDNSASMTEEMNAVEQNINVNFANIIQASGIDYRVIMVTDHGADILELCVGPPLSNTTNCAGPPQFVTNQFYHYDINVQSWDSACRMFGSMFGDEPDQWNLEPSGWNAWLRTQAVKVFVEITDDRLSCIYQTADMTNTSDDVGVGQFTATVFDQALLSLNPTQFGTVADRNYLFYSIVAMASKPNPLDAYTDVEAIVTTTCPSGVTPGTGYQWLSKGTGALRFPVCNYQSYDTIFQSIAAGVLELTAIPCEFDLPEAPPGQLLDLATVGLLFTPGNGPQQTWTMVSGPSQCGSSNFYLQGTTVVLCPDACALVEADTDSKIEVTVACQ